METIGAIGVATGLGTSLIPFDSLAQIPWWEGEGSIEPDGNNGLKLSSAVLPEMGIRNEYPRVSTAPNGDVWAAWVSEGESGEVIKLASLEGDKLSEPTTLTQNTNKHAYQPQIIILNDKAVVVWTSFEKTGQWNIYGAHIVPSESPKVFSISEGDGISWKPKLTSTKNGEIWITWEEM